MDSMRDSPWSCTHPQIRQECWQTLGAHPETLSDAMSDKDFRMGISILETLADIDLAKASRMGSSPFVEGEVLHELYLCAPMEAHYASRDAYGGVDKGSL